MLLFKRSFCHFSLQTILWIQRLQWSGTQFEWHSMLLFSMAIDVVFTQKHDWFTTSAVQVHKLWPDFVNAILLSGTSCKHTNFQFWLAFIPSIPFSCWCLAGSLFAVSKTNICAEFFHSANARRYNLKVEIVWWNSVRSSHMDFDISKQCLWGRKHIEQGAQFFGRCENFIFLKHERNTQVFSCVCYAPTVMNCCFFYRIIRFVQLNKLKSHLVKTEAFNEPTSGFILFDY